MRLFKSYRHRRWQRDISAYIDGCLEHNKQQALQMHLAECAFCQEEPEALRGVVALLRRVPQVPVPRSFALSEAPARRMGWGTLYAAPLRYATAAAALLLLAVAVGDLVTGQPTTIVPEAAPAAEREVARAPEGAPDEAVFMAAAPSAQGTAVPVATPTPQPRIAAAPEKTGAAVTPTMSPALALTPEKPRTVDIGFRWTEVALGVLLATLATLVSVQWWLGRRRSVR